jgi:ATP-dependent protease ClpP protease subunit
VIAEAGKTVKMHPVSMIMIHNVAGTFDGDYHDMKHAATVLQTMNTSLASAFVEKSGKPLEEVLNIMDKETWLTAEQAIEYGFADEIIHVDPQATNAYSGLSVSPEQIAQVKAEKAMKEKADIERAREKARLELELALY